MLVCLIPFQIEPLRLNEETTREREINHTFQQQQTLKNSTFSHPRCYFVVLFVSCWSSDTKKNKRHKNKSRANEKRTESIHNSFSQKILKKISTDEISTNKIKIFDRITSNKSNFKIFNLKSTNVSLSTAY